MKCDVCEKEIHLIKRKILGIEIDTYTKCDCQIKKDKEFEELEKKQDKAIKIKRMQDECFGYSKYKNCFWDSNDNTNKKIVDVLKRYTPTNKKIKKGLFLYGEKGTGKTTYASCIANEFIKNFKSVFFTSGTEYANADFDDKKYIENKIKTAYLVIFDDFGVERVDSQFMQEQLFYIINTRYNTGKLTIFTSNLTLDKIKNPQNLNEERLYSRIFEMSTLVEVKGNDKRIENLKKEVVKK